MELKSEMEREREKFSTERHSLASQLEVAMRESKDLSTLLRAREEVNSVCLSLFLSSVSQSVCLSSLPSTHLVCLSFCLPAYVAD